MKGILVKKTRGSRKRVPPQRRIFGYAAIVMRGRGRADARKEKSTRSAGMKSSARAPRRRPSAKKKGKKKGGLEGQKEGGKCARPRFCAAARRTAQPSLAKITPSLSFPRSPSRSPDAAVFSTYLSPACFFSARD